MLIFCLFCSFAAPSPPHNLKATVLSAWKINLTWLEPARKNGEILGYDVVVRDESRNVPKRYHNVKETKFEAADLKPFTNYTFSVTARGSGGVSETVTIRDQTFTSSECDFIRFF